MKLWYPRMTLKVNIHIFGLTEPTIYCKKMFLSLFLFFSMLLLCSFFRLKEFFQVKNGFTTSLLFCCFENAKNLGRSDDDKRRKKVDGLTGLCDNKCGLRNFRRTFSTGHAHCTLNETGFENQLVSTTNSGRRLHRRTRRWPAEPVSLLLLFLSCHERPLLEGKPRTLYFVRHR